MQPPRRDDDAGAVLVIVLLFVVVVGVVIGAVIDQVRAGLGNSVVVRNQQALTFAVDTGIEQGIQRVRRDGRLCPEVAATPTAVGSAITSNGRTVNITCRATEGHSSGIFGYAVVTTDNTAASLTTQGGGQKRIAGPVWSKRLENNPTNLTLSGGDLVEAAGPDSCSVGDAAPSGVTFVPSGLYGYSCSTGGQPSFVADLPSSVPADAPSPTVAGSCTTFYPGRYTAATWPGFTAQNYFVSGVYLFDSVTLSVSGTQQVVAGRRGGEADTLGLSPCSNDSAASGVVGTGVKFILGGSSRIVTASSGGAFEIFTRDGGPATDGTSRVAVMQVPPGTAGWPGSTLGFGDDILTISSGANPSLVVHGIVSTPHSRINVDNASSTSAAQFQGGILTGRLHLQNSGSSTGLVVSIETERSPRVVHLVVTSKLDAGDKELKASAVVRVLDDAKRTYEVRSWRASATG